MRTASFGRYLTVRLRLLLRVSKNDLNGREGRS